MERNDDRPTGAGQVGGTSGAGASGGTGGMSGAAGGYGNSGDLSGSQAYGTGSSGMPNSATGGGSTGRTGMADDQSITDRAKDLAGNAQEKLSNAGSSIRERAGTAKNSLADMLETGADKLRNRTRGDGAQLAGATGDGSMAVSADSGRMGQVGDRVAGGMQATADWLREADMEELRSGVERQVREHPGRTLLIALGLGYVIGKAFRK
jgi:hypothetical protein